MIDGPGEDPVRARPVPGEFTARPAVVAYSARPAKARYPDCFLSRGQAAIDVAVLVAVFVVATVGVGFIISPTFPLIWTNVIFGVVTITCVGLALLARSQGLPSIGLGKTRIGTIVIGSLISIPACYVLMFATATIYIILVGLDAGTLFEEKRELLDLMPAPTLSTFLIFGVFTGIHEEVLFRGFLLTRFNAIVRSKAVAVIVCSILFGAVHAYQGPMGMIQTGAIGLVLATLSTITRSVWPAIFAHAIFNSIQFALIPLMRQFLEDAKELVAAGSLITPTG